jgi:hypothetical protein
MNAAYDSIIKEIARIRKIADKFPNKLDIPDIEKIALNGIEYFLSDYFLGDPWQDILAGIVAKKGLPDNFPYKYFNVENARKTLADVLKGRQPKLVTLKDSPVETFKKLLKNKEFPQNYLQSVITGLGHEAKSLVDDERRGKLRAAAQKLKERNDLRKSGPYKNFIMFHATDYLPRKNKDTGVLHIQSNAMANGFNTLRNTVHFSRGHIVGSNDGGDWSNKKYVVLVPLNDIVEKNGKPCSAVSVDTFWSPSPDAGLVLPESAHIVAPASNIKPGMLHHVGPRKTLYKENDFSEEEIRKLLEYGGQPIKHKFGSASTEKKKLAILAGVSKNYAADEAVTRVFDTGGMIMPPMDHDDDFSKFMAAKHNVSSTGGQYTHSVSPYGPIENLAARIMVTLGALRYLAKHKDVTLKEDSDSYFFSSKGFRPPSGYGRPDEDGIYRGYVMKNVLKNLLENPDAAIESLEKAVKSANDVNLEKTFGHFKRNYTGILDGLRPFLKRFNINDFLGGKRAAKNIFEKSAHCAR